MSYHAPVFQTNKKRAGAKKLAADAKADIKAVIELLFERGMWSKFHYDKWMQGLEELDDEVSLHMWWDAVVNGAMFEVDCEEFEEIGLALKKYRES
jgi:hypothetical protein